MNIVKHHACFLPVRKCWFTSEMNLLFNVHELHLQ